MDGKVFNERYFLKGPKPGHLLRKVIILFVLFVTLKLPKQ
jgi:hypothetical protein